MSEKLDAILHDLATQIVEQIRDPAGYLRYIEQRLQNLADARPDMDDLKAALGQGIHKGMRVADAMTEWHVVNKMNPEAWDQTLQFAADGLVAMGYVDVKRHE